VKIEMKTILKNQRGAAAIYIAVFIAFIGIGVAALAIDYGFRHVAQNELQDAADAGALAGARALYYGDSSGVNYDGNDPSGEWTESANKIAHDTAISNISAGTTVEVNNWSANTGAADEDVQRGHWSFGYGSLPRGFYCDADNASIVTPVTLGDYTTIELDQMKTFINAVKVVTRREATPVSTFFGIIFGRENFQISAEAVAWLGYTGSIGPGEVDLPIAICAESIWLDVNENGVVDPGDKLDCNYGRMLNSGRVTNDHNTAGWTNFSLACETANPTNMRPLLETCKEANPVEIRMHDFIGTTGGVDDSIISHPAQNNLMDCWMNGQYDSDGDFEDDAFIDESGDLYDRPVHPWTVSLPVILCPGNNVGNCSEVIGAVTVKIVWILEKENNIDGDTPYTGDPNNLPSNFDFGDAPYKMENWGPSNSCSDDSCYPSSNGTGLDVDGTTRWNSFVNYFNLQTVESDPPDSPQYATVENEGFKKKSVYFLPSCEAHDLAGDTGGENWGMMAKIPKLVNIPKRDSIFN
jgi:hypothetical protein